MSIIGNLRTKLVVGGTCSFRIRPAPDSRTFSLRVECRLPHAVTFAPLWQWFGYDIYTRPQTYFNEYVDAEEQIARIRLRGYDWAHEHQCFLIRNEEGFTEWQARNKRFPTRLITGHAATA